MSRATLPATFEAQSRPRTLITPEQAAGRLAATRPARQPARRKLTPHPHIGDLASRVLQVGEWPFIEDEPAPGWWPGPQTPEVPCPGCGTERQPGSDCLACGVFVPPLRWGALAGRSAERRRLV